MHSLRLMQEEGTELAILTSSGGVRSGGKHDGDVGGEGSGDEAQEEVGGWGVGEGRPER